MTGSRLLWTYRAVTPLLGFAAPWLLRWRMQAGKEDPARIGERMGRPSRLRPGGGLAWLHGASVGESVALLPLIESLSARGLHVLMTTGTVNSAKVMAARLPAGATHQFVPLDIPRYVERFLAFWRPDIVLFAESELWPNIITAVQRRQIPMGLVNARMSERSARRWGRAAGFIRAMLSATDLCLTQTEEDAARFRQFGARGVAVAGNIKFDVPAPPARRTDVSAMAARIAGRPVFVAASTHADEEALLAEAHRSAARDVPGLLTIVVPRQPDRGSALAALAARRGLVAVQRSGGALPDADTDLYIADTMGELGLFYRLTDLVFLGKSLTEPGGGQNPIEAAKLGCAIMHGPRIGNFTAIYALLAEAEGAFLVPDGAALGQCVAELLVDVARLRRMARGAALAVERQGGATRRIMRAIDPFLPAPSGGAPESVGLR